MTIKISRKLIVLTVLVVSLVFVAVALAGKPDWWKNQEQVSNSIAETQITATAYPQSQMAHSLERENLKNRLLRFNNPNKIGYVYVMSFGKFVGYYTIHGKISSTQSQMTNTQQTWDCGNDCEAVVDSIGDDGSFGPNEGGDKGIFFFTTQKVLVETTLDWVYSDAPLAIDVPNLVTAAKK